MNREQFGKLKIAFQLQHNHINAAEECEYFDTNNHSGLCDQLRSNTNVQYMDILNKAHNTTFVGNDVFYNTFESLHEVDYDTLLIAIQMYKYIPKLTHSLLLQ